MSRSVIAGEAPRQGRDLAGRIRTKIPGRVVKERGPTNGPNHRGGLEPTLPHYECGVLAAGRPVQTASRGPPRTGLEPPPDPARPEERAQAFGVSGFFGLSSGAGGIRTPAGRVKSSLCCRYTTAPGQGVATFQPKCVMHDGSPQELVLNLVRHGPAEGRWRATSPQWPMPRVERAVRCSNPALLGFNQALCRLSYQPDLACFRSPSGPPGQQKSPASSV